VLSRRLHAVEERAVERPDCPNSAKRPHFDTLTGPVSTDMRKILRRKQDMVDREAGFHVSAYKASGAELIISSGSFVGPKTIEVS
jgi:pyruvate/2-oxoglutarate dehydrogenase complex dihydrolipoamide dehydrogenase (E3) component